MKDLLTFLNNHIKHNDMTVDEFCSKVGISRQKFYRYVKEPKRFTRQNVQSIIDVLSLKDVEAEQLNSYLNYGLQKASSFENAEAEHIISNLLRWNPACELPVNLNMIELIHSNGAVSIESPASLAASISVFCTTPNSSGHQQDTEIASLHRCDSISRRDSYEFTIYNCVPYASESYKTEDLNKSILIITQLIEELENKSENTPDIYIRHYLNSRTCRMISQENSKSITYSLHLISSVLPLLSSTQNYIINKSPVSHSLWTENNNLCLIKHTISCNARGKNDLAKGDSATEYYVLAFSANRTCCACRLGENESAHIYHYLSIDIEGKDNAYYDFGQSGTPNQVYYELSRKNRLIVIHPDMCLDDVPCEVWQALADEIESREDSSTYKKLFRNLMDPYGRYSFLGFRELANAAIETLRQRLLTNAAMGKIVICHPSGLQNFADTGMISDLMTGANDYSGRSWGSEPLRFSTSSVRMLLENIRDCILRRQSSPGADPRLYSGINYYILDPQFPFPKIMYSIYDGYGLLSIYLYSRHRNTTNNVYKDPAVGTYLYDYIIDKMIARRGLSLESEIMSDEHSVAFINKLISQLKN